MQKILVTLLLVLTVIVSAETPNTTEIQVGRYTTKSIEVTEEQEDVFLAIVEVKFDDEIKTVEDAFLALLNPKGFKLYLPDMENEQPHVFKSLPLPDTHRELGSVTLRDALETLAGPAWYLVQDPIYRIVSFEVCPTIDREEKSK